MFNQVDFTPPEIGQLAVAGQVGDTIAVADTSVRLVLLGGARDTDTAEIVMEWSVAATDPTTTTQPLCAFEVVDEDGNDDGGNEADSDTAIPAANATVSASARTYVAHCAASAGAVCFTVVARSAGGASAPASVCAVIDTSGPEWDGAPQLALSEGQLRVDWSVRS